MDKKNTREEEDLSDEDDIMNCPVLKDQIGKYSPEEIKEMRKKYEEIVKPMMKNKNMGKEEEKKPAKAKPKEEKKQGRKQHPRFEKFRQAQGGACPVMGAKLIEPADQVFEFGYNLRYKSRYEFILNYRGNSTRKDFFLKRKEFHNYPVFLKHTLIHGEEFDKVRNADFGNAFFIFDDIKTEGNLYYEDEEFYTAISFYEQAYSCFQWLQFTDPKRREETFKNFDLKPIYDEDVVRKEKDYKGDECEIDTRLSAVVNILLNLCCAYMRLTHFTEALQCCDEIIRLTTLSAEAYFRRSQIRTYNLKSTFHQLSLAEEDIEVALSKRPEEEKYIKHKEILAKRKSEKMEEDRRFIEKLLKCAKKGVEFKKSKEIEINQTLLEMPREIKIMKTMKSKYADCMEFFRDTEDNKQIPLLIKEFKEFSISSYQKMMKYYKFDVSKLESCVLESLDPELRLLLDDEQIRQELNNIKVQSALNLFGEGKMNFQLFKFACDLVFDAEKKRKKRMEERQKKMTGITAKTSSSTSYSRLAVYGIITFILLYVLWNWIVWRFFVPGSKKTFPSFDN